jgi:citrate lyase gamma subunit
MDTTNPYERRSPGAPGDRAHGLDRLSDAAANVGGRPMVMSGFAPGMVRHGIEIQDQEATERLVRQHEEDLRHAQRRAWNEGHDAGQVNGQRAMLRSMDEQYGDQVRAAIENASELLHLLEAGDEKVKKGALSVMLAAQTMLLRTLLAAHHNAFVREVPF